MNKTKNKQKIRPIKSADYPAMADFLYHAIFLPPGAEPLPHDVIEKSEIAIYIDSFGSGKGDVGVIAEHNEKIVGMAWTRIIPAFGHVDDDTPELAISVLPEYRGKGIGTKLMKSLFEQLAQKGFKQTSLSVQKENPALRFYERLGYKTVSENDEDFIMVRDLKKELQEYGIGIGLCLGVAFGAAFGTLTDNLALWMGVGMCLGVALGNGWYAIGKKKKK